MYYTIKKKLIYWKYFPHYHANIENKNILAAQ